MKATGFLFLCFFLITIPKFSQSQNLKNEFGFRSDNDSYLGYGQDRYYTNGLFITYRYALKQEDLKPGTANKIWEAEIGQYMYNAQSGQVRKNTDVDRPFAAYLYAGTKLSWFFKNEQSLQAALNIGTIGPNALGEKAQNLIHKTFGFYELNGWQYQSGNEIGVNAALNYSKLVVRKAEDNDLSLQSYLNIGNTFSGAGAGILFRAGKMNKFFKTVSNNSRISNSKIDTIPPKEFFFFTRPMLNYIAYDATVEGGLFADNKGVVTYNPKRFQYSQEIGINYAVKSWTLNFSVVFKSKDTNSQLKPHQYGSAVAYYRF